MEPMPQRTAPILGARSLGVFGIRRRGSAKDSDQASAVSGHPGRTSRSMPSLATLGCWTRPASRATI